MKPRIIPLAPRAMKVFKALDKNPLKFYDHHKFYQVWAAARDHIAPSDKEFVPYAARHTFATNLVNDSPASDLVVANLMGHKSLATTKKYAHPKDESNAGLLNSFVG